MGGMNLRTCLLLLAGLICISMLSAVAEAKSEFEDQNWAKSKCMNFRSNKDVSPVELALKLAHDEGEFSKALTIASELMDDKLGCQQRYDIADFGYKSAVAISDFASAQKFMPVMRKFLEQKGRDVVFFDQLIQWVDANRDAHDASIFVADRDAIALRDRTLFYLRQDFRGGDIPKSKCDVLFSISEYGRPMNVNAVCEEKAVARSIEKHVPRMLFAPKVSDGKPVVQEAFFLKVNIQ